MDVIKKLGSMVLMLVGVEPILEIQIMDLLMDYSINGQQLCEVEPHSMNRQVVFAHNSEDDGTYQVMLSGMLLRMLRKLELLVIVLGFEVIAMELDGLEINSQE